ncbi:MAG: hypothetical protein IJG36_08510, partial [Synergistaceae bacterium]|nr:hypothetical protein [Synergistaceae bacterium]
PGAVHDSWLASFGFSPYARRRTQAVLDDFHALLGSGDKDSDCLLAVFPYAFIAGRNRESLLDRLSVSMKISSGLRKELAAFMGEYDE